MFWWPCLLVREANTLWPGLVSNHKKLELLFAAIFCVYLALLVSVITHFPSGRMDYAYPMLPVALLLFVFPIYFTSKVAGALRAHQISTLSPVAAGLLFIVYGASLPILQSRLNAAGRKDGTT